MNKKYLSFGLMGLFVIAMVSAGLVNYLSNTEEVKMDVTSPIFIEVGKDMNVLGGETHVLEASLTNNADAEIKGRIQIVIKNDGISLDDFTTLIANIKENGVNTPYWNSGDLDMKTVGGFIASIDTDVPDEITIVTTDRTFDIGEYWDATIAFEFEDNAKGRYKVEITVIPLTAL